MNLIRKVKISKINNIPLTGIDKEIVDFIILSLSNLTSFQIDTEPESIYYMNSKGKWILEQNNEDNILYIRYYHFWEILEDKYSLKYDDIQILLKYIIGKIFKEKLSMPYSDFIQKRNKVEQDFQKKLNEFSKED